MPMLVAYYEAQDALAFLHACIREMDRESEKKIQSIHVFP